MKLRIGHLSTFYHTAVLLMAGGGTEDRLGADIEWRLMGTGPAIMQSFERGELDLAYIGLPPAIIGIDRGIPVVCIAGGHMEGTVLAGRPSGGIARADPGEVLQQFRGQAIGVPSRGSIHDVILRQLLDEYSLAGRVQVRNFSWADLVLEAVVADEVRAAIGTPALAAAVKRYAKGEVLLMPSQLWPSNPSYGIVVRRDLIERHADVLESFLRLHEEAEESLRLHPGEAAGQIAEFIGIVDRELVLDALSISPRYCAQLTDAYIASTMQFVPVLKELGYIRQDVPASRVFQRELIDTVHPGKDHYHAEFAGSAEH